MLNPPYQRIIAFSAFLFLGVDISISAPPINRDAKAVGGAIPNCSMKGGNVNQASAQMRKVLGALAKTNRNSRSSLEAVIMKGLDFRKDIGPYQQITTTNAILNVWDTAYAWGAINEKKQFTGRATRGRYAGQNLVFENIVPAKSAPEFAGYIGNLRLVPAKAKRTDESAELTIREAGFLNELRNVKREYETRSKMLKMENRPPIPKLAINKEQEQAKYQAEVEEAGDLVKQEPVIRLKGQRLSSPSKMNGNRYRVLFEATNLSRHPTEIELECKIVGYTDNENKLYLMKGMKKTLKLRRSEVGQYELWTDNVGRYAGALKKYDPLKSTKVYYRGYIVTARFNGKVISAVGSDGRLQRVVDGVNPDPIPKI